MNHIAVWTHCVGNGLASIIGGLIALVGLVCGLVCGAVIGALLSVQLLFTNIPRLYFPLSGVIRFLARVAHADMDSVAALQDVLSRSGEKGSIEVHNTQDDEVILKDAALCTGVQSISAVNSYINCFWYGSGGHNRSLQKNNLVSETGPKKVRPDQKIGNNLRPTRIF
jgi:hypothetical protein